MRFLGRAVGALGILWVGLRLGLILAREPQAVGDGARLLGQLASALGQDLGSLAGPIGQSVTALVMHLPRG